VLLTIAVLEEIRAGRVTVVYRLWQKPTVKTGGTLRTALGALDIVSVAVIDPTTISDTDAQAAGWASPELLIEDLFRERKGSGRGRVVRTEGERRVYRVEVAFRGGDTRAELRSADELSDDEIVDIVARLDGYDRRSAFGPWTRSTLQLIDTWPARRAPELAELQGRDTLPFKNDVRKLKELGLTESLTVGYRLSPRGKRVWTALTTA
jgi:hypothetical protein